MRRIHISVVCIADSSLTIVLLNLLRFAHKVNKPFTDVTRDDVLVYLEHMKVGNKWKRTYALSLITVTRFFKWLYSPDIGPKERPKPAVVVNLGRVKFDKKTYKNKDIWTLEDNEVFFKYCPDPKIKCYHGIAVDTGARPHEILGLKIEDSRNGIKLQTRDNDIQSHSIISDTLVAEIATF